MRTALWGHSHRRDPPASWRRPQSRTRTRTRRWTERRRGGQRLRGMDGGDRGDGGETAETQRRERKGPHGENVDRWIGAQEAGKRGGDVWRARDGKRLGRRAAAAARGGADGDARGQGRVAQRGGSGQRARRWCLLAAEGPPGRGAASCVHEAKRGDSLTLALTRRNAQRKANQDGLWSTRESTCGGVQRWAAVGGGGWRWAAVGGWLCGGGWHVVGSPSRRHERTSERARRG